MKKSVILLILAVYVGSIALVGIFGMNISFFDEHIYAEKVECENSEITTQSDGRKTIVIPFTPDEKGVMLFQLIWHVLPDNTTDKEVLFSGSESDGYSVSNRGVVTFYRRVTATIYITAQDGSNKRDAIQFILTK